MRTRALADEVHYSAHLRFPWRSVAGRYPTLFVNCETRFVIARVGVDFTHQGVALKPREVAIVIRRLRALRRCVSPRGWIAVEMLAATLETLTCAATKPVALIENGRGLSCRSRIVRHEQFHCFQYAELNEAAIGRALKSHPITRKALPHLERLGYDTDDATVATSEIAARISSGDYATVGLSRREGQRWLSDYFNECGMTSAGNY